MRINARLLVVLLIGGSTTAMTQDGPGLPSYCNRFDITPAQSKYCESLLWDWINKQVEADKQLRKSLRTPLPSYCDVPSSMLTMEQIRKCLEPPSSK